MPSGSRLWWRLSSILFAVVVQCCPRYVYVLANGERLRWSDAYATREDAEKALIEDLKTRLVLHQVALANLQHEMAQEEVALRRLEKAPQKG